MSNDRINDVNIVAASRLRTPDELRALLPLSAELEDRLYGYRETVRRILDRADRRVFIVVGPCSIHNTEGAFEYAQKLKQLSLEVEDAIVLIMRVYFEKPRTSVGWKGFINDPFLDDSFRMDDGLYRARELLLRIAKLELPAATEALDTITPQYIGDLITWTAIGARTTESQTHREMASGLSTAVGFKNGTDGTIKGAINALKSALQPHHFLGITPAAQSAVFHTRGNRYVHIVLRGGPKPNYDPISLSHCEAELAAAGLPANIVVDCSHGNTGGEPKHQPFVLDSCVRQIQDGNASIVGFMIESYLKWGRQAIPEDHAKLDPGLSITDACVDWATTERMIRSAHEKLKDVLPKRG